jgi:hypothetical protein
MSAATHIGFAVFFGVIALAAIAVCVGAPTAVWHLSIVVAVGAWGACAFHVMRALSP